MREYDGDIRFVCLEPQILDQKQFGFSLIFYAITPQTLFGNNSMHSRSVLFNRGSAKHVAVFHEF